MALETGSYIGNLVATNPTGADPKSQGDDHIRLLKTALLNCFAGFTGAVLVTGTDGGAANAYTVTPTTAVPGYVARMVVAFSPTANNTGASTINISGLGVKNIVTVSNAALVSGDLVTGTIYLAAYDGTSFRLLSITKNYADQLAMSAALPAQSLGFLRSDGSAAAFTQTHTGYAQNEVKGADVASAATINLTTATGNLVHITGTTTITAITIPSGADRTLVFDGVLTLTHNATTLILPTGANITTAAGDSCVVRGDGSGNARVVSYQRANGNALAATNAALVLIAGPLTPTAAANVDFLSTFNSTYDDYLIVIDGIRPAANDRLKLRYAVAGAAVTTSSYFNTQFGTNATAADHILVSTSTFTTAGIGVISEINIRNANHATQPKGGNIYGLGQIDATPTFNGQGGWSAFNGGVVTGFRLFWEGGANFAAQGTIKVYGIAKA